MFTLLGTLMYASRPGTTAIESANATLATPFFTNYGESCLGFQFMFSSNSNVTLSLFVLSGNDDDRDDVTTSPLWRIRSSYPSKDTWKSTEVTIAPNVVRLLFVSLHEVGGIYGVGLDNVTITKGPCKGKCNFSANN